MARMRVGGEIAASGKKTSTVVKKKGTSKESRHGRDLWSMPHPVGQPDDVIQIGPSATPQDSTKDAVTIKEEPDEQQKKEAVIDNDDIALPTPIHAPCRIIAADGRVATIYTPIAGFEHLFQASNRSQEFPCSESTPSSREVTSKTQQRPLPGTTSNSVAPGTDCLSLNSEFTDSQPYDSIKPHVSSSVVCDENGFDSLQSDAPTWLENATQKQCRTKVHKKTRSITNACTHASDNDGDSEADERQVRTVQSRTFRMGDFKEFKLFLRHRMDELTMKPFRPIVTLWIKLLEPKRLREYGSYHKFRPSEAPEDSPTPPWWPRDCHYNEPSHLSKTDLVTLATDIILQHRPKDDNKRRLAWVSRLREAADCALGLTPPEQFSSSDDPVFGKMMRDRARDCILPSLFNVAQSYEDYVHQYRLWEEEENAHVPRGKTITWVHYERPPRQSVSRKRKAKVLTVTISSPRDRAVDGDSGDETEVDETMANNALRRAQRYQEILHKKRVKLSFTSQEDTPAQTPQESVTSIDVPSIAAGPGLAGSVDHPRLAREVQSGNNMQASPFTSFDRSMHQLGLSEDSKSQDHLQPVMHHQHFLEDCKPGDQLPSAYAPPNMQDMVPYQHASGFQDSHYRLSEDPFKPLPSASLTSQPALASPEGPYMCISPYYVYNNTVYSTTTGQPLHNEVFYNQDGLYHQQALDMASSQSQILLPLTGLPYDFTPNDTTSNQAICRTPALMSANPMSRA